MLMTRTRYFLLVLIALVTLLPACDRTENTPSQLDTNNLWAEYIAGHTSGLIPRRSNIQIQLVSDLIPSDRVGQSANDYLDITPKTRGRAVFETQRQIVFVPDDTLSPGEEYSVAFKANQLFTLPDTLSEF